MAEKPFFYDDCRSADRLAREWTRIAGGNDLVVEYQPDIGEFAYSVTMSNPYTLHVWRWNAAPSEVDFDAVFLFKKYMSVYTSFSAFGLTFDVADIYNYCGVYKTDMIYMARIVAGATYYKYFSAAIPNNVWYYWKVRKVGKDVRLKFWQYGTSEPDWMYTNLFTVPTGYNENPVKFQPRGGTRFGIYTWLYNTGDWAKITDIRITPLRRTGP